MFPLLPSSSRNRAFLSREFDDPEEGSAEFELVLSAIKVTPNCYSFSRIFSSVIFMLEWSMHEKGGETKSEEKEKSSHSIGANIVTDLSLFGSLRWRLFFLRLSSFASVFCLPLARFLCSSPPYLRAVHIQCSPRLGKKRKKTASISMLIGWSSIEAEREWLDHIIE